ncbi:MAG: type II toxin-antitoxin system HicA family toxin [Allosphingosinicella sp.]|uniref:type II toxin-antitoxin system HicA family toxin n=1 Tax=Allosphingosinicella sp. TaxID=2823234 RepID=UPI0039387F85
MTRPAKLYLQLLENPSRTVAFRDFEALLLAAGFQFERQKGSHRAYRHPAVAEVLTVQPHGSEARRYQVRKFLAMMEEHGLELEG